MPIRWAGPSMPENTAPLKTATAVHTQGLSPGQTEAWHYRFVGNSGLGRLRWWLHNWLRCHWVYDRNRLHRLMLDSSLRCSQLLLQIRNLLRLLCNDNIYVIHVRLWNFSRLKVIHSIFTARHVTSGMNLRMEWHSRSNLAEPRVHSTPKQRKTPYE